MNSQFEAAWEIHHFLTARCIPYAIIGGLAVQRWGEPRFTQDVDVTILVPLGAEEEVLASLLEAFAARIPEALAFALRNRVLLLQTAAGCNVDVSLGLPGYEEQVAARAVDYDLGDGRTVRICSAEDLIIHKAVAGRPQDMIDIEGVILQQGQRLDVAYVRHWLEQFAELMETDEVKMRFEAAWKRLVGG
jgi:hypothetical protein